ncbi:hypothetical protein [uncultured Dialister sp.]|uniref:hypothetical protein n=1 Tax=uncultured Dialister sp. TaxID=278064 RepID=UPI0026601746|nr:hypothetical protein [uncultured Dialister sp.]
MDPVNTRPKGMSIAIGNNAKIDLGTRTEEALLSFGYGKERGKDDDRFGYTIAGNTEAKENLPEGIAIGTNSFARAGSIEIGAHNLGADVEIGDTKGSEFSTYGFSPAAGRQLGVASTTVGTNSYANGMFTMTYGSYNVQSSQYQELHVVDTILDGYKNAFGTVVGSLNSNESIAAFPHSGAENSIIGTGNRVNNSSGTIAIGTGNEVKNTWGVTSATMILSQPLDSPKAMQDAIIDGAKKNPGGAVMAIGNGNKVDSVSFAQVLGTGNELKGQNGLFDSDKYVMIDGYNNSFTRANNTTVIGTGSKGSYVTSSIVMDDNANVENTKGSVMIGDTNSASYVNSSLIAGAKNSITGTEKTPSASNILSGVGNTASAVQHVSALSAVNGVTNADRTQVLGDRNRTTNTNLSQMFGVNNVLSTTDGAAENAKDIQIGYGNSAINVQNVTSIGSANTVLVSKMSQVIGDNRYLFGADRSVVIGSADSNATQMTSDDIVAVGYNSYATASGGAAFGSGSVAGTAAGYAGYDPLTNLLSLNTSPAWKSTRGAVSVNDIFKGITRQITGVAAGTQDTDAVNVAQLKKVVFARQNATQPNIKAGNGIQVIKTSDGMYTISANITGTTSETGHTSASVGNTAAGTNTKTAVTTHSSLATADTAGTAGAGNTGTSGANSGGTTILPITPDSNTSVDNGEVVVIRNVTDPTSFKADDGNSASISPKGTLSILGDSTNTETSISGDSLKVSLKKDITVDSVKAGNTTINNDGVSIKGGPSMTSGGINAGGRKVTNVATGEISASSTDAVNGSQIHELKGSITNNTTHLTQLDNRVGDLDHRVNEVGAGAAALAGLHPVDYDPDSK